MIRKFKLRKLEESTYEIYVDSEITEDFKASYTFDSDYNNLKPIRFNKDTYRFELETDDRPFVLIEYKDEEIKIAERTLSIDGLINFRDMGGYYTEDNRQVKWGKLYRSDQPFNANKKGIETIKGLNLHTIFDYRSQDEIQKYPTPNSLSEIQYYNYNPQAQTAELSAQFSAPVEDEDQQLIDEMVKNKEIDHNASILEQYRGFVYNDAAKETFKNLLKISAQEGSAPLLHHCRGGKDRTGFGALLILGLLGVPDDTIIYDFMLTKENRKERNQIKMDKYRKITQNEDILKQLYSLIDTKEMFLTESINMIKENYSSIKDYVINELEVTQLEIDKLRKLYLY